MKDTAAPTNAEPTFEDAVTQLSEIVQKLEHGDLPLEESLRLFERGVLLARVSQQRLDSAQKRVEQLLGVDESGRPRTKPFEVSDEEPTSSRSR